MNIRGRSLKVLAIAYMYIPVIIFLGGFTRWYYATVTTLILLGCLIWYLKGDFPGLGYKIVRNEEYDVDRYMKKDNDEYYGDLSIHPITLLIAVVLIAGMCIALGIGGVFPQAGDWEKHNAVLNDLVVYDWPVYYIRHDKCMLTYYLGQYLVPAIIGKISRSFGVANVVMVVWSIGGLILVYLMLLRIVKADEAWKQILTAVILLFFCGGLSMAQLILKLIYSDRMYSMGSYHWLLVDGIMLQYRSNLIMIRWVLPQIIVPYMATLLFLEKWRKAEYYVLIILPSLLFGSFSFASLAVIALMTAGAGLLKKKMTLRQILSPLNILPAISLGTIFFLYFLGNLQVKKPVNSSFTWQIYDLKHIVVYIVFCTMMFGIYVVCVFKENRRQPVFYAAVIVLLVLPWMRMGLCNDVVMSGSIPSLFVLMIMVIRLLLDDANSTGLGMRKGIAIVILLIGCIYPICELSENIRGNTPELNLSIDYGTMSSFTDRSNKEITEDLLYNYYTYDMDGKIFYEY
ncbi:MAG: hypothetical protein IK123_00605, partial [Lachnospiraceae bacterium]|nr:hypothetical protein [Lachnospiraceae bacterium]